jgi:hypothetical protein
MLFLGPTLHSKKNFKQKKRYKKKTTFNNKKTQHKKKRSVYTFVLKRNGMYRNENIPPYSTSHTTHPYHFPHTIAYPNINK